MTAEQIRDRLNKIESMTDGYYGQFAVNALRAVLDLMDKHGFETKFGNYVIPVHLVERAIADALGVAE
jgi:hypothetical protein